MIVHFHPGISPVSPITQIGLPIKGLGFVLLIVLSMSTAHCTLNVLRFRLTGAVFELFSLYKIFNKDLSSLFTIAETNPNLEYPV